MSGEKKTYIVRISYDGRNYFGWRRQKHESLTLQQVIEDTLRQMTGLKVNLHAASWTDAGVHAQGQVAAMVLRQNIDPASFRELANALLPDDIAIFSIEPAPRGFDPIGGNLGKHYKYTIATGGIECDPGKCWLIGEMPDIASMQTAADKLVGTYDFRGIRQSKDRRINCVRTITCCTVSEQNGLIEIDFHGDNFIYMMIRSLVAALVEIGTGKKQPDYIDLLLNATDNRYCPVPAPPQGLCLIKIQF